MTKYLRLKQENNEPKNRKQENNETENSKTVEYKISVQYKRFCIEAVNKKDKEPLTIPFEKFYYPQLCYEEAIEEDIVVYIEEHFPESKGKTIQIEYTEEYRKQIVFIVAQNRLEFD